MFNVNDPSVTKYVIYAYNGDDSALGQIDNGVAFTKGSSSWLIWFSQAIPSGKNVRINYLILFKSKFIIIFLCVYKLTYN